MGLRQKHLYLDKNCFFVTTVCHKHMNFIDLAQAYQLIENSLAFCSAKYNASILGYVIMPNHVHLIIFFNSGNKLSDLMRDFKKFTATHIRIGIQTNGYRKALDQMRLELKDRSFKTWKDRYDDLYIRDRKFLEQKLEYMHLNPLQQHWNLASRPEDYLYSSARFYLLNQTPGIEVKHYLDYF